MIDDRTYTSFCMLSSPYSPSTALRLLTLSQIGPHVHASSPLATDSVGYAHVRRRAANFAHRRHARTKRGGVMCIGWRLQSALESWSVDFSVVRSPTTTVVTDRQYFRNGVQKRQVVESRGLFMTDCGHEPSPVLGLEAGEAPHHAML